MAKYSTYVDFTSNSDATFRNVGASMNAAFVGAGLVQTSDTGQINWTTVTKPSNPATFAGYEMYRFNDSLQATAPVFIKIGYYTTAAASGTNNGLQIGIGTSTDGAGNLTGINTTSTLIPVSGARLQSYVGNTTDIVRACHAEGVFHLYSGRTSTNSSIVAGSQIGNFSLSRSQNPFTGAITGEGLYLNYGTNGASTSSYASRVLDYGLGSVSASLWPQCYPIGIDNSVNTANRFDLNPHYMHLGVGPRVACGLVTLAQDNISGGINTLASESTFLGKTCPAQSSPRTFIAVTTQSRTPSNDYPNTASGSTNMALLTNELNYLGCGWVWE